MFLFKYFLTNLTKKKVIFGYLNVLLHLYLVLLSLLFIGSLSVLVNILHLSAFLTLVSFCKNNLDQLVKY